MMIAVQDRDEFVNTTHIFYKKHYFKKHWFSRKMFMGYNLLAHNIEGEEVLLGTFESREEIINELHMINNCNDLIYYISIL